MISIKKISVVIELLLVLFTLYNTLVGLYFYLHVRKEKKTKRNLNFHGFSLIIPFRNESKRIKDLLDSLNILEGWQEGEVIFVDDHSEDDTSSIIKECSGKFNFRWTIVKNKEQGKKQAVLTGINLAKNEKILLTDADCLISKDWIQKMLIALDTNDLVLGLYSAKDYLRNDLLFILQKVEFTVFSLLTYVSAKLKAPFLASGASMGVRKNFYLQSTKYLRPDIASGDDMFLLNYALEKSNNKIKVNAVWAFVKTDIALTWQQYFSQKLRWMGKMKHLGTIIKMRSWFWGINFLAFYLMVVKILIFNLSNIVIGLLISLIKVTIDVLFISLAGKISKIKINWIEAAFFYICYPWVILWVNIMPIKGKPEWKNRKIK